MLTLFLYFETVIFLVVGNHVIFCIFLIFFMRTLNFIFLRPILDAGILITRYYIRFI